MTSIITGHSALWRKFSVLLLAFCFFSCEKQDIRLNNPNDTLRPAAEFIRNNYEYSLFSAAIEYAGLVDTLNGRGPYTIMAPNDEAFRRIGISRPEHFQRLGADSVRKLVLTHILAEEMYIEDIPFNTTNNQYTNLMGNELRFARVNLNADNPNLNPRIVSWVNGVPIAMGNRHNINISNGIFHELTELLKYHEGNAQDWLETQGNYEVLIAGLKRFGYWDRLTDGQRWTIMAPSDEVFENHGITLERVSQLSTTYYGKRLFGAYLFPERFFLNELLLFNSGIRGVASYNIYTPIVGDEAYSNGLGLDGYFFVNKTYALENRWQIIHSIPFNYYYFGGSANLPVANHHTNSGIIHQINGVILLPEQAIN
ncbi:fasciclin domain-containing protein [Parapedobacter deserti]|uniref:Fasciclin domain-containing protein n=1 Tax=Parapedobacter deserti TaxID=1912957 RepID=A0ABV7JN05_9SPHI